MNSPTVYLAVGALLVGLAHGQSSEECGKMQDDNPVEMAALVLIWPAALSSVLLYEYELPETVCDERGV